MFSFEGTRLKELDPDPEVDPDPHKMLDPDSY
jgi:hypothetical protein